MEYLRNRIDRLGELAEKALEDIPTEISTEEFLQNTEWTNSYLIFEDCTDYIDVIKKELDYGDRIADD